MGGLAVTLDEFHPFSDNNLLIKDFVNGFRQFPASGAHVIYPPRVTGLGRLPSRRVALDATTLGVTLPETPFLPNE